MGKQMVFEAFKLDTVTFSSRKPRGSCRHLQKGGGLSKN